MNTLMTMDPWKILDEVLDNGSKAFSRVRARAAGRFPPVNVFLDDDAVVIDLELPGKTAKDVELSLEPQAVTIADRPAADPAATPTPAPAWSRRLEMPFRINADKANAKFSNGILRIELPKAEAVGVRHIEIK